MEPTVYLSHPVGMPALGDGLEQVFSNAGKKVLSRRRRDPQAPWPETLTALLRQSDWLVTVLSPDGPDRWQQRELNQARRLDPPPTLIAVVPAGAELAAALAWPRPWVELLNPEQLDALPAEVEHAAGAQQAPPAAGVCPYPGLRPFTDAEACLFHGRERALQQLVSTMHEQRITLLLGAAGAGKRSLVRAGLFPRFAAQGWEPIDCRPSDGGFHALASALVPLLQPDTPPPELDDEAAELGNQLEAGSLGLADVCDQARQATPGIKGVLLHLDGLDHLIEHHAPDRTRAFLTLLRQPMRHIPLRVVASVSTARQPALLAALPELTHDADWCCLGPLTRDEMREVIERPAAVAGLTLEEALTRTLIDDAMQDRGHLGLLACALRETWRRRNDERLDRAAYIAAKGLDDEANSQAGLGTGACLQRAADAAWQALPRDQRAQARRGWERLLERADAAGGSAPDDPLASAWPEARAWTRNHVALSHWRRGLDRAITHWQHNGEQAADLLQGPEQLEAMAWAERCGNQLNDTQRRFIAEGREATRPRSSGKSRRRGDRRLVAALSLALVASISALAFTTTQWWMTTRADSDPAFAAYGTAQLPSPAGTDDPGNPAAGAAPTSTHHVLHNLAGAVTDLSFSKDGKQLITAATDGSLTLWSVASGTTTQRLRSMDRSIAQIKLTRRGRVAALGTDASLVLWEPPQAEVRTVQSGGQSTLTAAAFNSGGGVMAMADTRNGLNLYWTKSAKRIARLPSHLGEVIATVFAPAATAKGGRLASGGEHGDLWLWDLATREPVKRLIGHRAYVDVLSFDASGDTLLSAGGDGHIRLWSSRDGELLHTLKPTQGRVVQARFAPAGTMLAAADSDGNIELWDAVDGTRMVRLQGHSGKVHALAFAPNADWLASAGKDRGIRLWSLNGSDPIVIEPDAITPFDRLLFGPNGRWLAASSGGTAHLWLIESLLGRGAASVPGAEQADTVAQTAK